jgi:hypothetical protein
MLAPCPNPLLFALVLVSSSVVFRVVWAKLPRLISPFLLIHAADRIDPQLTKDDDEDEDEGTARRKIEPDSSIPSRADGSCAVGGLSLPGRAQNNEFTAQQPGWRRTAQAQSSCRFGRHAILPAVPL